MSVENIRAYVRVKPTNIEGEEIGLERLDSSHVLVKENNETFTFETVFGPEAHNLEIFEEVIVKNWDTICKGVKSTLILT